MKPANPTLNALFLFVTMAITACSLDFEQQQNSNNNENATGSNFEGQLDLNQDGQQSNAEKAVATGSAELASNSELVSLATELIAQNEQQQSNLLNSLFAEQSLSLSWDPTHDSALLAPTQGENSAVLISNDSANGIDQASQQALAIAGSTDNGRYLVFGGNPFRNIKRNAVSANADMHEFLIKSIEWLTQSEISSLNNIVLAQLDESYYFPDFSATKDWLVAQNDQLTINERLACDEGALQSCLTAETDLLIISQWQASASDATEAIANQVEQALDNGIDVLYLHHDGNLSNLGEAIFNRLQVNYVKDNYWSKQRITDLTQQTVFSLTSEFQNTLKAFINNLENGNWSFELANCDANCANQPSFQQEFASVASSLQSRLRHYDKTGIYLFNETGRALDKILLLLADNYRSQWQFPTDINNGDANRFLRTLFADYAQLQRRNPTPAPADLGNFSRVEFPGVQAFNKTVNLTSLKPFRAAGVYALPGQKVTVTRQDDSDVAVSIFVNTVRDGATHIWDEQGYKRPKFLRGQAMTVSKDQALTFTSTYGGPIQIAFDQNHQSVSLTFSNIAQHPFWRSADDNQNFANALAEENFDWAELVTPAFEVHSKLDKMQESANNPLWPTAQALAETTMTYTFNYPHVLAGYQGDGIAVVDEIHDFAKQQGWRIHTLEQVKHMNADQATCGYGCSGNPYDAYWSFNPIGHGDIHELGHGLERARFRFDTKNNGRWELHSTTNPYSYYSKSQHYINTGEAPNCQKLPFDTLYEHLQAAANSKDAYNYMQQLSLASWNTGVATYIQFMMATENQGFIENGWHLWARLHIFEREYQNAIKNDTNWQAQKQSLGMASLDREAAKNISNNDWMLIGLSLSAQADFRDMLKLYGIENSQQALDLVSDLALPRLAADFYLVDGSDYCLSFDRETIALDGVTAWPM